MNEQEFRDTYIKPYPAGKGVTYPVDSRVVASIDLDEMDSDDTSPFIEVKAGGRTLLLNPLAVKRDDDGQLPYIDVDVHAFVDGEDARTAAFGMEEGIRTPLQHRTFADGKPDTDIGKATSAGWPATKMVVLLLGEQTDGAS